jgi:hypothetical protein
LGQGVEPDVDHAPIAPTLDVAGHVTVGDPFRRTAGRVFACPSRLWSLGHADDSATDDNAQIINPLGIGT